MRHKSNIEALDADSEAVIDLELRRFTYDDSGVLGVGLIAEAVDETLPELVIEDAVGRPDGVKYDRLGVFLIPEVAENRDRLGEVDAEIDELRGENEALRAENRRLREGLSTAS